MFVISLVIIKENNMFKIGVDLGGSHVAIGVVDDNGNIVEKLEKNFTIEEKKNVIL